MTSAISLGRHARLLYVLLDAADNNAMMSGSPIRARWQETKEHVLLTGDFEGQADRLRELLVELETSGTLAGTWIGRRWLSIESGELETD